MFAFEGHGLEYMPFAVRRMLDLAGLRPSLADWQRLGEDDRRALAAFVVVDEATAAAFRDRLLALLPEVARVEPVAWAARPWQRAFEAVEARAGSLGVTLERASWDRLDDVARYALHRLADPRKDPVKLRAALRELA